MAATSTIRPLRLLLITAATGTLVLGASEGGPRELMPARRAAKKSTKGSKGSKSKGSKGGDPFAGSDRAIAFLAPAPGSEDFDSSGALTVTYNPDGSFLMTLDAAGLDPACVGEENDCRVVITKETDCDDAPGQSHYAGDNPWEDVFFETYNGGFSNSAWNVNNGYTLYGNRGRAVVVYRGTDWAGCGLLREADDGLDRHTFLQADIGRYPGYEGDVRARGTATVHFRADATFRFGYDLAGLEAYCVGCGVHIHAGLSCDTHEEVLGHEWNTAEVQDLWTTAGGATYATGWDGRAEGYFNLFNGYSLGKNFGHAVVVHGQDGTRVGCGVLEAVLA